MRKLVMLVWALLLLAFGVAGCAVDQQTYDTWGAPQRSEWEGGPWRDYSP